MNRLPNELKLDILRRVASGKGHNSFLTCLALSRTNKSFRALYNANKKDFLETSVLSALSSFHSVCCRLLTAIPPTKVWVELDLATQEEEAKALKEKVIAILKEKKRSGLSEKELRGIYFNYKMAGDIIWLTSTEANNYNNIPAKYITSKLGALVENNHFPEQLGKTFDKVADYVEDGAGFMATGLSWGLLQNLIMFQPSVARVKKRIEKEIGISVSKEGLLQHFSSLRTWGLFVGFTGAFSSARMNRSGS